MNRDDSRDLFRVMLSLSISICITGIIAYKTGTDITFWWKKVLWPLCRLFGIMLFSLWLSALIEAKGWSRLTAVLSMPLLRLGNFSTWSGTAFSTAFVSGIASNTLLWNFHKEGRISRREMFLALFLNAGLPSYILHLPVTFAIIVPLAGPAGITYMVITLAAALVRTIMIIAAGRLFITKQDKISDMTREAKEKNNGKIIKTGELFRKYVRQRFVRIATYTIPIYLCVVIMQQQGVFDYLRTASAGIVKTGIIPVEGVSVVVFALVSEFASGAAAAGAMLSQGVLTVKETVLALIIGNIIAAPVRAIRHQLPRYMGIFQPATGLMLLVSSQLLRISSVMASGIAYYFMVS